MRPCGQAVIIYHDRQARSSHRRKPPGIAGVLGGVVVEERIPLCVQRIYSELGRGFGLVVGGFGFFGEDGFYGVTPCAGLAWWRDGGVGLVLGGVKPSWGKTGGYYTVG